MNAFSKGLLAVHGIWAFLCVGYALLDGARAVPPWLNLPGFVFLFSMGSAIAFPLLGLAVATISHLPQTMNRTLVHGLLTVFQVIFGFVPLCS